MTPIEENELRTLPVSLPQHGSGASLSATARFYQTQTGDRWDKIAHKFYGDVFKTQPIIEANPDVPLTPILKPGITLLIPVLDTPIENKGLPIWKQ